MEERTVEMTERMVEWPDIRFRISVKPLVGEEKAYG